MPEDLAPTPSCRSTPLLQSPPPISIRTMTKDRQRRDPGACSILHIDVMCPIPRNMSVFSRNTEADKGSMGHYNYPKPATLHLPLMLYPASDKGAPFVLTELLLWLLCEPDWKILSKKNLISVVFIGVVMQGCLQHSCTTEA